MRIHEVVVSNIKKYQKDKRITNEQLCAAAKINENYLRGIYKGEGNMTANMMDRFIDALGLPDPIYLFENWTEK